MFRELSIKNIALIDEIQFSFHEGLNVLTGETGAGKSIIMDSISLLLGCRADRDLIRYGSDYAYVEAIIDIEHNSEFKSFAKSEGFCFDSDEIIVSREISLSGKNICKLDGRLLTVSQLKSIMGHLVHLYGQNQHVLLQDEKYQLNMLDAYIGEPLNEPLTKLESLYNEYLNVIHDLEKLSNDLKDKDRRMDILLYQINEIEKANLKIGEEEELISERATILNAEKISKGINEAKEYLSGENGVLNSLKHSEKSLSHISSFNERIDKLEKLLNETYYALEESAYELSDISNEMFYNEKRIDEIDDRLSIYKNLKRKYGASAEEVLTFCDNAKDELLKLESVEITTKELEDKKNSLLNEIQKLCDYITDLRKNYSEEIKNKLTNELLDLGMNHAEFEIEFSKLPFGSNGQDDITFMISLNKGEPLKALSKVASGGEISRIMLALQNITAVHDNCTTMIFDEVDTGISGNVARMVGKKMSQVSRERQVICVTHLLQIAVMADTNYVVEKKVSGERTMTNIRQLNGEEIAEELARLSGGDNSEQAILLAKELMDEAYRYKN